MRDRKQIYDFAVKWCDKFRDQRIDFLEIVDHWMGDDCAALGFIMDSGRGFSERYGNAVNNVYDLDQIIDDVTDISLLGSAIYSRWHYFSHGEYTGVEILEPENRGWFILALGRLAMLSGDNPFVFQGKLKKLRIMSNNLNYGVIPEPNQEVEQHITINNQGQVRLSGFSYGDEQYEKVRSKYFKIDQSAVDQLFDAVTEYFSNEYEEIFATDIGNWNMELINMEGITYKFRGSLCSEFDYKGMDLSDLIRDTVGMDDLYVFDGNFNPEVINKITLDYRRITKIKTEQKPENAEWEFAIWDYGEHLIIDRGTKTLEHIQNIARDCKISHKYEIEDGIESLLDDFQAEDLFAHIKGNPDDVINQSNETKDYKITIEYKKKPSRIITGSFDKNGLPEDFAEFVEIVFNFIRFYGLGEIFDPSAYGKIRRRKSECIYCSVSFDEGYKSYYYLIEDDSIEVGDYVIVPAGEDNHKAIAEVVKIEYFVAENVPWPLDKTKRIIRKCTREDFESDEE